MKHLNIDLELNRLLWDKLKIQAAVLQRYDKCQLTSFQLLLCLCYFFNFYFCRKCIINMFDFFAATGTKGRCFRIVSFRALINLTVSDAEKRNINVTNVQEYISCIPNFQFV